MRSVLVAILCVLPASSFKNRVLSLFTGYDISPAAVVRPCVVWNVAELRVASCGSIGIGNVFQHLTSLVVGNGASMGRANWVTASPLLIQYSEFPEAGRFEIGAKGVVTARHHIDCSGGVNVGDLATVAGHGTSILTHQIDIQRNAQTTASVRIGCHCFIGAACVITAGTVVADRVVVGAGSVVVSNLYQSDALYAGVPAKFKRSLDERAAYFERQERYVWPAGHPKAG